MASVPTTSTTADRVLQGTEDTILATRRAADGTLDRLADQVDAARTPARPRLQALAEQAETLAQRGSDAWHEGSAVLRDRTRQASERAVAHIRNEPVKSVLIAAAAGAALLVIADRVLRSR